EGNNSGSLEHINKSNSSWDKQVAQETKELKEITNTQKEELKENKQNNNTSTHNEEVIEVNTYNKEVFKINTHNKEVFEISTRNEDNTQTTTCNKEVSETSTALRQQYQDFKKRIGSYSKEKSANIRPEQEPHAGSSANKEENPYLQDDASITDSVGLQENDLTQDEQKGPLSLSIK
ncbi:22797_t:CDS:2, partial [Cetraspora pellucida]